MLLVVVAHNGVLFLVAWELMSLASFFLVAMNDEKESVRRVGWTYLVAMHLGTAFLLALFLLLGQNAGSLDFERLSTAAAPSGVFFVLAVIGFGTKAGFIPMHVWLPEAHPAAPSHVSAVMSGVMIKTGIYGLLRILHIDWTAGGVVGLDSAGHWRCFGHSRRALCPVAARPEAIVGLLQRGEHRRDCDGTRIGLLGISHDNPVMATLGFAGALLHVINHALFKSLLFLGPDPSCTPPALEISIAWADFSNACRSRAQRF